VHGYITHVKQRHEFGILLTAELLQINNGVTYALLTFKDLLTVLTLKLQMFVLAT